MLLSMGMLYAQEPSATIENQIKVGDELEIGRPAETQYRYIDFPTADAIIRKGGSANFKSVEGMKVIVTAVREKKDGSIQIKLKRKYGDRFFGSFLSVTADLKPALKSGELQG